MNPDYPYEIKKVNAYTMRWQRQLYIIKTNAPEPVVKKAIEVMKESNKKSLRNLESILWSLEYFAEIDIQVNDFDFEL